MGQGPISRRRFLAWMVAAGGAGLAGLAARWRRTGDDQHEASATTLAATSAAPTTTMPSPIAATTTAPSSTPSTTTTTSPPQQIQVICREAWGAEPPAGELVAHRIEHLTVHHTAVVLDDNRNAPARVRQHQRYHLGKGWPDLAYHFIIDRNGHAYEGRPVEAVGDTATDYDPTGHFLVCCEGDFNVEEISTDQYDTLVAMLAWAAAEFRVDPATIRGHRDLAATSCPGDNVYVSVADGTLSGDVVEAMDERWKLTAVCGQAGAELVAAIEAGTA